ncbi:MAG: methyltransferase domain-containing protein [Verrucomicrobia bacterium]|nr:methyltransferase domain-containing protein [Verrucomicrobiota bacterium]
MPIFRDGPVQTIPPEHRSNALGAEFEELLRDGSDLILHIGAGATSRKYPNCVELEYNVFANTDVVGDAHALPFRDGIFDRVFAFNVFEHLAQPAKAAAEIWRVLKPAGAVTVHSAFLQPLHEAPHHFFNATEFGLREWFDQFEIEQCRVSGNFGPGMMLGFLLSGIMSAVAQSDVSKEALAAISDSKIGEWAGFWAGTQPPPPAFGVLQSLPQSAQAKVAAGFELIGRKRPK